MNSKEPLLIDMMECLFYLYRKNLIEIETICTTFNTIYGVYCCEVEDNSISCWHLKDNHPVMTQFKLE